MVRDRCEHLTCECRPYLAEVRAGDWGLYHDIPKNPQVVLDWLGDYGLSEEEIACAYARITAALETIKDEEKPRRSQRRARVSRRTRWWSEVEGAAGTPVEIPPE